LVEAAVKDTGESADDAETGIDTRPDSEAILDAIEVTALDTGALVDVLMRLLVPIVVAVSAVSCAETTVAVEA
jgi:hypothetical protein